MNATETVSVQMHSCLRYLAEACDFASERDGAGFNKIDTWAGHTLAAQQELSLAEVKFSYGLVKKYRKQLERGGLSLPSEEAVTAFIGENKVEEYTRRQLREIKNEEAQAAREAEYQQKCEEEKRANPDKVYMKQGRIVVEFTYNPVKVAAMQDLKSIKDWAFNRAGRKEWSFPKSATERVLEALKPFDDFQYDDSIEQARQEALIEAELARQQAELEAQALEAEKNALLEIAHPYLEGQPLPNGRVLFQHQREAVTRLLTGKHIILAHDMGLGKSLTSLVAAKCYGLPVFVICPASLKLNWLREAEGVGVAIEVYSWAKLPEPLESDYVVIADEAHYAQNLASKRTQGFLDLASKARAVFCLSGTPIKNGRPVNLFPLLVATRSPLAENKKAYESRYCNAHYKNVGRKDVWDVTGAAHLDELFKKTQDIILYRKKEDCIDLPPKVRVMRTAEVSPDAERAYTALLAQLRQEHKDRMDAKRETKTQEVREALEAMLSSDQEDEDGLSLEERVNQAREAMDDDTASAIVELGQLRHAASTAKVESAVEIAREVLEQDGSIVLFVAFRDSAARIASELQCEVISGGQTTEQRQAIVDRFQAREQHALVCLLGAGGVGITLTAAQTVVLVDRPWTPGDAVQAEDRLHRIGQQGSVTAIWLQYGAIDEKIDTLLEEKYERIGLVLEGKRKSMRGTGNIHAMAKEILRDVLSGRK